MSHFFAGEWNAIPAIFNYQVHELLLAGSSAPPPDQERVSRFYEQMDRPDEVKVWHYSGKEAAVCVLLGDLAPWMSAEEKFACVQ